jgi:asparagine synthase (glutamine-hydrolysing)
LTRATLGFQNNLFENACKIRMRSDVPVACALSGGLDSSSVYSMLYHLKKSNSKEERVNFQSLKGFVATFDGTEQDETDYARSVVDFCKGEAEFLSTDFNNVIKNIESSTRLFNDITATPISVLGDVYKNMRKHNYLVSMDGHGADEMLYGYRSLVGMALTQSLLEMDSQREKDLTETYLAMFHPNHRAEETLKLTEKNSSFQNYFQFQ